MRLGTYLSAYEQATRRLMACQYIDNLTEHLSSETVKHFGQKVRFRDHIIRLDERKNIKIRMLQAEVDDLKDRLATAEKLIDYIEGAT